ncbi:formylglycine-generating enzyme family protein [Klebsiella pneumoniae]|uniref:formylglycine-generating enzyme family protein n=1 Tax=Klebsiella pneumoniae TaxID=573 RepID=UPI000651B8E1|nr:SUMF1/EgtB/PvdO family nonheme iron enzyme [Klebsiella pneumoniae]HDT4185217.1 SUMF1/EgtB/PvdO family nonheme iron enzyme [Klebsiella pneumoniae subsp. pneumoniae]ELA1562914.1 SUMF1/EgtB/PvdO family nonheme iron enzyme [Klebsiella pneumoniae]ELA2726375.1 SUMF1/EgtB/PvdO family nonheme iron enzyme [Klebsiella pneumoniae]KMI52156.1 sulfatase modifying factor 1 -like protein [Klebsiella pneumoniae]MBW5504077.1 SUMF1/EgtB/PvdO family nonheme iron enzyme [Klebsiella pneumoniae]
MRKLIVVASVAASLLLGCDQKSTGKRETLSEALVAKSLSNMVPVQGGEFLMGDFGPLVGEKLPFSINQDDKVLHKVVLSDFSISKFKVTNDDYNKYLQITGIKKPPINILVKEYPSLQKDDYSVGVTWQQAKDYCQWLGKESDKNIDLPTEAQWEYAARSRGQYLPFSTNNGNFELGSNIPEQKKLDEYTDGYGFPIYPIGKYPPNPLGLYDMGLSGAEWSNDWYSTDYYSHSPVYDPQGPVKGNEKVLRGYVGGDPQYALTIFRQSSQPVPKFAGRDDYQKFGVSPLFVFRCVINK